MIGIIKLISISLEHKHFVFIKYTAWIVRFQMIKKLKYRKLKFLHILREGGGRKSGEKVKKKKKKENVKEKESFIMNRGSGRKMPTLVTWYATH